MPLIARVSTAILVAAVGLRAQTPNTVWVHVTVTDAKGQLVTTLNQDDFAVLDNGAPRAVSVFSKEELPIAVSLMLDVSGSMASTIPDIRRAADVFMGQFIRGDRVNVGTFASDVTTSLRFTANRERVLRGIDSAIAGADVPCDPPSRPPRNGIPKMGGTALWDGVECGVLSLLRDGEAVRRVVMLVTDGIDNASWATEASAATAANRAGVLIYAVGLFGTGGRAGSVLRDLTAATGGGYYPLEHKADFSNAFQRIGEELHTQYILGFEPDQPGTSGTLKVSVKPQGLTVRARKSYSSK